MAGYSEEKKLEEYRQRRVEKFCAANGITREEYSRAESMAEDLGTELHRKFWEVYNRDVPPADNPGPAERRTARHRKRGPGTGQ